MGQKVDEAEVLVLLNDMRHHAIHLHHQRATKDTHRRTFSKESELSVRGALASVQLDCLVKRRSRKPSGRLCSAELSN